MTIRMLTLLLAAALLTGCQIRGTTDGEGGGSIELGPEQPNTGSDGGASTTADPKVDESAWPYPAIEAIKTEWRAGRRDVAIRIIINLSREMNRRVSAGQPVVGQGELAGLIARAQAAEAELD